MIAPFIRFTLTLIGTLCLYAFASHDAAIVFVLLGIFGEAWSISERQRRAMDS